MSSTSFPTVPLGRTGMAITRIGLGAWAMGGNGWAVGWGAQDDSESIEAIRHAVDRGINWIDTAAVYGLGHAEDIVRQALAQMPRGDRPYVFTKCGLTWSPEQPPTRISLAAHSRSRLCLQSARWHAPTMLVTVSNPPLVDSGMKVSQSALPLLPATLIAKAWQPSWL